MCVCVCVSKILLAVTVLSPTVYLVCSVHVQPSPDLQSTACGGLLMCPQVADPSKPLPTLVTAERFLPRVNSLVLLQVSSLREAFSAGFTAKRFLPGVDSLVGLQIGQTGESLAAGSAYIALPAPLARHDDGSLAFIVASQEAGLVLCSSDADLDAAQRCCVSPHR